jgi:hypothetical protein
MIFATLTSSEIPTWALVALVGMVGLLGTLIGVLWAVLRAVKADAKNTGKVEEQVKQVVTQIADLDSQRDKIATEADGKIAAALALHYEIVDRQQQKVIETVKGFQGTVDELKMSVANIMNMWAGERRLLEEISKLKLSLEHLQTQHEMNHPARVSQANRLEEGAPGGPWGEEGSGR